MSCLIRTEEWVSLLNAVELDDGWRSVCPVCRYAGSLRFVTSYEVPVFARCVSCRAPLREIYAVVEALLIGRKEVATHQPTT